MAGVGLPVALALLAAAVRLVTAETAFVEPLVVQGRRITAASELERMAHAFRFFNLPFVVFLAAMELFGNLFRSEIADRTLHHVFLTPVRRELTVVGKYLAGVVLLFGLTEMAWITTTTIWLAPHGIGATLGGLFTGEGLHHLVRHALMLALAATSYGAVFLLLGLVTKKPLHVGVLIWLWEWVTVFLPASFQQFTIIHYLDALSPVRLPPESPFATIADPPSTAWAAFVLITLSLGLVTLAAWRARGVQLTYSDSD